MAAQNYDRAVLLFSKAVSSKPESTRYKVALSRAKMRAAQEHFSKGQAYVKAGRTEAAIAEFQQAVYLDPSHQYAANELSKALAEWQKQQKQDESEMERLKRKAKEAAPGRVAPRLNPASNIPIVLRFKDKTVQKIYDALSKASGINFIYDDRLDLNKKTTIDLADVTFEQALNTLMTMNKHFFKIWDENTILIADDNQQKHKEYDDLVVQTFYLSNADVKDVQVLLRTLLDARQLAQNDRLNSITIRDTPDRVQVAQKIIESNDKAKSVRIGDRIPIPTTTFNAAPTVGGTVGVPITSFTYQNVGINIDVEPRVHHNKEITLKLKVEVSSLAGQISAGNGLSQPIIGTREIDTTIRLKDQETNLLAGLIREEERKSMTGLPGLSSIPVVRRIFGNTETNIQQTDIVLTLTPHIIRIPDVTEEDLLPLWIGTESNIALRGGSKSSPFGTTPVEGHAGEAEELPPVPGIPELPVEEAPPAGGEEEPLESTAPLVAPAPEPTPTPAPLEKTPSPGAQATPSPTPSTATASPTPKPPGPVSPATVFLNPTYLNVNKNQTFTVSVNIRSASAVGSVPFHLQFDPQYLDLATTGRTSPFLSQDGALPFVLATLGAGGKEVIVGLSREGSKPGVSGQGVLIEMTFLAKKSGTTTLNFTDISVLDPSAQRLPFDKQGMTVNIQQ